MEIREIPVTRTARYALTSHPDDTTTEVWFACHGYSQLAAEFLTFLLPAARPGRVLVAPEGLSRFYVGGGTGRVGASWMTREGREAEIRDYVAYLDAVREHIIGAIPRSPRVTILGFSQGTATAFRWAVQGGTPPERLILWGGGAPDDHDPDRIRKALAGTDITLVTGTEDTYATPAALERDAEALRALGLQASVVTFDGGHRISRATLGELANGGSGDDG